MPNEYSFFGGIQFLSNNAARKQHTRAPTLTRAARALMIIDAHITQREEREVRQVGGRPRPRPKEEL